MIKKCLDLEEEKADGNKLNRKKLPYTPLDLWLYMGGSFDIFNEKGNARVLLAPPEEVIKDCDCLNHGNFPENRQPMTTSPKIL